MSLHYCIICCTLSHNMFTVTVYGVYFRHRGRSYNNTPCKMFTSNCHNLVEDPMDSNWVGKQSRCDCYNSTEAKWRLNGIFYAIQVHVTMRSKIKLIKKLFLKLSYTNNFNMLSLLIANLNLFEALKRNLLDPWMTDFPITNLDKTLNSFESIHLHSKSKLRILGPKSHLRPHPRP